MQKTEYSAPRAPPVPLRLSNVAEIDVILGSGTARGIPFCLDGVCLRLKSPVDGVLGINMVCPARMQSSWLAEYSQKCTALPRGPVRAAKTMPTFLSASPFCCTDFSECRARISYPSSRDGPEGMKFVARDRKSTRLNSSHNVASRMPSSA